MFIDTHLHLVNENYDIDSVIMRAKESNVNYLIVSGSDLFDNRLNKNLLSRFSNVFLSVGFHPSCAKDVTDDDFLFLEEMISLDKVVAIGEIGLDYHYGKTDREEQIRIFERQLEIAVKYNLPVVIHTRDAFYDTFNILKKYSVRGVIHCFSGSLEVAKEYLSLGFYLGIGGVVTFKNSKLKDIVKEIGLDKIVLETDSPYLSPFRGEKNEPCNVKYIASFLSDLLGITLEEVAMVTTGNACTLFDLDLHM